MTQDLHNRIDVNPLGVGEITLGKNINKLKELVALTPQEKDDYIFRPSVDFYKSLINLQNSEFELEFSFDKVFVAFDSSQDITKIILLVKGKKDTIINYLNNQLNVKYGTFSSSKNKGDERVYYIWHTEQKSIISLADFSDLYHSELVLIELFPANEAIPLTYSIIKNPKLRIKE